MASVRVRPPDTSRCAGQSNAARGRVTHFFICFDTRFEADDVFGFCSVIPRRQCGGDWVRTHRAAICASLMRFVCTGAFPGVSVCNHLIEPAAVLPTCSLTTTFLIPSGVPQKFWYESALEFLRESSTKLSNDLTGEDLTAVAHTMKTAGELTYSNVPFRHDFL